MMHHAYDSGVEELRMKWRAAVQERQSIMQRADDVVRDRFKSHVVAQRLSRSVLVLEDTAVVRMAIADRIRHETRADVHEAATLEDANQLWVLHRPAVVVVDVHLANGESGLDFLSGVGRGPRAIIYSGYVTGDLAERVARLSHARFVDKGDPVKVAAVAKELLDEAVPEDVSPEVMRQVINAMHEPVSVIRAIRDSRGKLSDMEWTFVNDAAARQLPGVKRGTRLRSVVPNLWSLPLSARFERAFDHIESFDGEVDWFNSPDGTSGGKWLLRLVNLGNDQLLVSTRRKV